MQISESIEIVKPTAIVWLAITGIENSSDWISNIISIEIIEKPKKGVVGLKWKEIRKFCGKEVTEVMWVTDSVEHDYYCSRAESHGSVYTSRISLKESNGVTTLTISFTGEPQTLMARFLSTIMNRFIIKSLGKELRKDLSDIKKHVEQS
ncbi:MAG: SRPBCC family protein [Gammaproteobacteria bacterium]|nr:SRPBCC family protein [Gammaproteobacteria bacterium]